jgi:hypothetical protein
MLWFAETNLHIASGRPRDGVTPDARSSQAGFEALLH